MHQLLIGIDTVPLASGILDGKGPLSYTDAIVHVPRSAFEEGRAVFARRLHKRETSPVLHMLGWLVAGLPLVLLAALGFGALGAGLGAYLHFSAGLPKIPDLRAYRPKTVSTFYAEDGTVIGVFYKEKRFPIALDSLPPHVVNAFLGAEDARFFSHPGVDFVSVVRAVVSNLKAGSFAQGGSTITQQVTRNFMLSKEKKLSRKIREAILSFRLEKTFSKKEILEIYLNEIYLGKGAYGVEAAARTYFGKNAGDLTTAEAALLAGLVSNPSKFSPFRTLDAALKRRQFTLDSMLRNGFISESEHAVAMNETPKFRENLPNPYERAPYFTEAVRQYIVEKYGENQLYHDGLRVWTTCDLGLQKQALESLSKGVLSWENRQRRPAGLVKRLTKSEVREFLDRPGNERHRAGDLIRALVVTNHTPKKRRGKKGNDSGQECTLALAGNFQFQMNLESRFRFRPNDLLEFRVMEANEQELVLEHETTPPIQGALVCIENNTGYVRSLVGGLDFERSRFNRAVQAFRQPGSAFKPFLYAAALEWGKYGPQTLILDEPIAVLVDPREPEWIPGNSDGRYLGLTSFRDALALSRNVVAVKVLMDVGIDQAVRMARNLGIRSALDRNLSLALGTSEVTPLELTAAYTVFPNMGVKVPPVLVKKVVDRFGNVLEDNTVTPLDISAEFVQASSAVPQYDPTERAESEIEEEEEHLDAPPRGVPTEVDRPDQSHTSGTTIESLLSGSEAVRQVSRRASMERVLSPTSAYLMLSMLRQTCVSGTAAAATKLRRRDVAGKTGTTDDCTDAWFIGFNPKYTTGVWVGYDTKTSLGKAEYGGTAALPVWMDFMKHALQQDPVRGYPPPQGIAFAQETPIPASARPETLLEAHPDFWPQEDLKPVCPIDYYHVVARGSMNPFADFFMPLASGQAGLPGAVRILSPSGEQLGVGYYVQDQHGKLALHRELSLPADETRGPSPTPRSGPGTLSSQAPRLLDFASQFLGVFRRNGWIR